MIPNIFEVRAIHYFGVILVHSGLRPHLLFELQSKLALPS
ncbi:hypothetical protein PSEUDO8O_120523 [Pseudomonas sp. 8O]|nr:hypothetical protein PSEUDO8O_120523 [Pseudomonas sp. 8O]